jgi:hypothetical protein
MNMLSSNGNTNHGYCYRTYPNQVNLNLFPLGNCVYKSTSPFWHLLAFSKSYEVFSYFFSKKKKRSCQVCRWSYWSLLQLEHQEITYRWSVKRLDQFLCFWILIWYTIGLVNMPVCEVKSSFMRIQTFNT